MKINIATASTRLAKVWKNETIEWSELVERCSHTQRTNETLAEYKAMSRERQARVKDVGGFVGGYLKDGLRRNGQVVNRSVITLDIDFPGNTEVWEDFTLAYNCAAFLYSTHKHTKASPRFRLVVLLNRPAEAWEYEPVARRVAETIGLDKFDGTTYELPRLFYWPSTSKDGEFVFESQDGPVLNVDEVLGSYANPKDATTWPRGKNENVVLNRQIKKAGEPTAKPGLVGAFCRAYSISEVIDAFLSDTYDKTAHDDRYTYRLGSVAGGLVVYGDKFAYSHHDTDPASRQLCNAFDLVRVHLYGEQDEKDYDDITKAPSYASMCELAGHDKKVNALLLRERQQSVSEDFADIDTEEAPTKVAKAVEAEELAGMLESGKNGILSSVKNVLTILENDPKLAGKLWHDDFSGYDFADKSLPWKRSGLAWSDADDANLRVYLDLNYGITAKEKVADALTHVFSSHKKHPVRDYLNGLKWDGVERLDTMVVDYLGAQDNELNRAMTRKQMAAAVARVMEPGIKFDYCLILAGGEGIGKSTLLKVLGGEWFSDSVTTMEGKEGMESLRRAWIIELAELASVKRSDVEQIKNFLSKQEDVYRAAYGKRTTPYPRQCVFWGTTNEASFLKGDTGNRRFWVIAVDSDLRRVEGDPFAAMRRDRDQLWAEAVVRYREGERLYLDEEMEKEARGRQRDYNVDNDDPVPGMLDEFLDKRLPADWYTWPLPNRKSFFDNDDPLSAESLTRDRFFAGEFVFEKLGIDFKNKEYGYTLKKVNKLMKEKAGWSPKVVKIQGYGPQRGWVREVTKLQKQNENVTENVTAESVDN